MRATVLSRVLITTVALWFVVLASSVFAEEVEVRVQQAEVKVWDEVVAEVKEGQQFEVLERRDGWVAISVETEQGVRRGWILSNNVKTLMDPNAAAPPAPRVVAPGINVTVESIQLGFARREGQLVLRTTIENKGPEKLSYDVDNLQLKLGGDVYENDNPASGSSSNFSDRIITRLDSTGSMSYLHSQSAQWLSQGELKSGETVEGWVRFKLPEDRRETEFSVVPCKLVGDLGNREFTIDLRATSLSSLAATPQTSSLDPTIPIWEVYGPINALNIDAIRGLTEQQTDNAQPETIIVARSDDFFIDSWSLTKFGSSMNAPPQRTKLPALFVPPPQQQREYGNPNYHSPRPHTMSMRISGLQIAPSEEVAAIRILSFHDDATFTLLPLAEHEDPAIRRAVLEALIGHRDNPEVVDVILEATTDSNPTVRIAAVNTLAGIRSTQWPGTRFYRRSGSDEPLRDEESINAVLEALQDENASVRSSAARAARQIGGEQIADALIKTLSDTELSVVSSAAGSLVAFKSDKVVAAFKELRKSDNFERRAVAIRSLKDVGELSAVEAAIAQLQEGKPSSTDFGELEKRPDENAIKPLISYLQQPNSSSHYVDTAARILGKLEATEAVDALLEQLRFGQSYSQDIPRALGRIGDKKAIEPLWQASRGSSISSSRRVAIYEALIDLGSEKALNEVTAAIEKKDSRQFPVRESLKALARSESKEATQIIARYLDESPYQHPAAQALALQGTRAAIDALKERLLDADFSRGSYLISALQSERSPHVFLLLRAAANSKNPSTRQIALSRLNSLNSTLQNVRNKRNEGDLDTAIRYLENTAEQNPGFLAASVLLGNLYRDADRQADANSLFKQATDVAQQMHDDEMVAGDWGYAGHAAYRAGRYEFAKKALNKSIELRGETEPTVESGPRWWFLAMTLNRLEETEKAKDILTKLSEQVSEESPQAMKELEAEAKALVRGDS